MQFGVLGALRATVREHDLHIGSPKLRIVLAYLILRANQPVSTEELAEAIWGEAGAPDHPRRTVQLCVTRLRSLLGPANNLIATRPGAYVLTVAPEHTDIGRFRQWLNEADRAGDRGDAEQETEALGQALAQWRGEALHDVPSELLHREDVPSLTQLRLQTQERRLDAELRLGRHTRALAELVALTARHPLRERLWLLLMRAQAASGRRSEALTTYHTARQHLSQELGVEPGDELHAEYLTILSGQTTVVGHPVPRQLPANVAGFTGRVAELNRLDALAAGVGAPTVAAIVGTAGVGKTSLATHWARHAADAFPDGQLWLDFHSFGPNRPLSAQQALAVFLRALGISDGSIPAGQDEQAALYRSVLDGRRVLIVLDNVSDAAQVRPLLPGSPGSFALITSRNDLTGLVAGAGAARLVLDLMSLEESREFLAHRLGTQIKVNIIDDLIATCARLPLALAVVAARMAGRAATEVEATAEDLRRATVLEAFAVDDAATDMRRLFSWSYRALSPTAAELFRLLGLHPGTQFSAAVAASLCGVTRDEIRPILAELHAAHLISRRSSWRYFLHDLLHAYAGELVRGVDRSQPQSRMLAHYLHSTINASKAFDPFRPILEAESPPPGTVVEQFDEYAAALSWLTETHPIVLSVIDIALESQEDETVWNLCRALAGYLDRRSYWHDEATVFEKAVEAAGRLGDPVRLARAHSWRGSALMRLMRLREARASHERARELTEKHCDKEDQARMQTYFGWLCESEEDLAQALRHHRKALDLYRGIGNRTGEGRSLACIAWDLIDYGEPRLSLTYAREAFTILTEIDDQHGIAGIFEAQGYASHRNGRPAQAIKDYRRSLEIYGRMGFRYEVAAVLNRIGDAQNDSGDQVGAETSWRDALLILDELGNPEATAIRKKLDEPIRRLG